MKIDPFLIFSAIGLIVLIPLGFTLDHKSYEGQCKEPPILYFQKDLEQNPNLFKDFCNKANTKISIVARTLWPIAPDPEIWIAPLKAAVDRGVSVEILSSQQTIKKYFNFTTFILTNESLPNSYTSFAVADNDKVLFSSQLFGDFKSEEGDYYIDFKNCKSIARDAQEIIDFYKQITEQKKLTLFPHYYCSGISYPNVHTTNGNDAYSFSIAPTDFVSPGRESIITCIQNFFNTGNNMNISLFTTSLFSGVNQSSEYMPELLMSDQIETSASLNNNTIRILMSSDQYSRAVNTTMSLSRVPNVLMGVRKVRPTSPSFYVKNDTVIFMPMSFEAAISLDMTSLALTLKNAEISQRVEKHFEEYWYSNSTTLLN